MRLRANLEGCVKDANDIAFSPDGAHLAISSDEGVVLFDPDPFQGLFHTTDITQENVRWLGQTLTKLGYLNPQTGIRVAAYRGDDVGHIALTLPQGAAADEIIVTAIRDEVGPVLAERIGPKLAIHLCTETFQVERTIEVERPLVAVPSAPVANLIAPVSTPAEQAPVKEVSLPVDDLQGAWRVKQFRLNGRLTKFGKATVYRFREGKLIVETNDGPSADFTYTVDSQQTPAQLDLVLKKPDGDVVSPMIYKIVGDVLTVGYAAPGGSRPTEFNPSPSQKQTIITFVRIKEDLPSTSMTDSPVSLVTPTAIPGNSIK
jgi:uncharacterized protein (TIGR03067 family)